MHTDGRYSVPKCVDLCVPSPGADEPWEHIQFGLRQPKELVVFTTIDRTWPMRFMHNQLEDRRCFRLFNVIDDFNRRVLGGSTQKQRLAIAA